MRLSTRTPWYCLLGAVVLVPLVVGVMPLSGLRLTLNVFVQAKLIVLCIALALTLASWALTALREKTLYTGRALIPLGAFVVVVALTAAMAIDPRMAVFGDSEQGVGALVFLLCALLAYLTTQLVRNERTLAELTDAVIFTATAIALIGLVQQLAGQDPLAVVPWGSPSTYLMWRGFGTIGNPDTYAAYLVLPGLLAVARVVRATDRNDRVKWGLCGFIVVMSLVIAQTRGPILGLVAGGLVYAILARIRTKKASASKRKPTSGASMSPWAIAALLAAAVGAGLLLLAVLDPTGAWRDFVVRFTSPQSLLALGGRLPLWSSALQILSAHPILGVGPDSFRLGWYPVRTVAHLAKGAGLVITDPHSVPLLVVATTGIAGLLASAYLLIATPVSGFKTTRAGAERGRASDYEAWLAGVIALSVTLLSSMLASVLLFTLFLGLGVLIAPGLRRTESPRWTPVTWGALRVVSLTGAAVLMLFALFSGAGQLTAVGAQTPDASLTSARTAQASAVAPWDTQLRSLRYEALVRAALDSVYTGKSDGPAAVAAAEKELGQAALREPSEYLYPYRSALLLIGAGEKLGVSYTTRGIAAGLQGLRIYPNSLELRTGVASGYLKVGDPAKATSLLKGVWDADPNYLPAGLTYAKALVAQGKAADARAVLALLKDRFPKDPAIPELEKRIQSK